MLCMPDNSIYSTAMLPDDVSALKEMVTTLKETVVECHSTIERLKQELMLLRQWRFGRKSEKLEAAGQMSLFPGASVAEAEVKAPAARPAARKGHGRKPIPASLPVERIEVEVPAEELVCQPCGSEKVRIGEETRRELDYTPGSIHVREYVRPVY